MQYVQLLFTLFLFPLSLFFFSTSLIGSEKYIPCKNKPNEKDKYFMTTHFCSPNGVLKKSITLFLKARTLSQIKFYDDQERIVNFKIFNIKETQTKEVDFKYNDDGTYIRTEFSIKPLRDHIVSKQKRVLSVSEPYGSDLVLEKWYYNNIDPPHILVYKDHLKYIPVRASYSDHIFNMPVIETRTLYKEGRITDIFDFEYIRDDGFNDRIRSFRVYGPDGLLRGEFSTDFDLNVEKLINRQRLVENLSEEETERRKRIYRDQSRPVVVVFDSGIDVRSPNLTYKLFNNPYDTPNGMDDDSNGLVDDTMGWSIGFEKGPQSRAY